MQIPNILIIDDNGQFSMAMYSLFSFHGFEVDIEPNPKMAIKRVRRRYYDFVMCEYILDGQKGTEILRKVIKNGLNSNIHSFLITQTLLSTVEIKELMDLGINYELKPISPPKLSQKFLTLKNTAKAQTSFVHPPNITL